MRTCTLHAVRLNVRTHEMLLNFSLHQSQLEHASPESSKATVKMLDAFCGIILVSIMQQADLGTTPKSNEEDADSLALKLRSLYRKGSSLTLHNT